MSAPYALPPLNGLRAFETVARHLSFQKAAEELFVTPGAISQQIKKLEDILQVPLFIRDSHGVSLTEAGQQLLPGLSIGFEQLEGAVQQLKRNTRQQHVTISATPSFAAKWLVPRLENWTKLHPEIDIRISASLGLANFIADGIDIAIRFGSGIYEGLNAALLLKESFVVVCSPIFIDGSQPITSPDDLRHQTLIHVSSANTAPGTDWQEWLKTAGIDGVDVSRGLVFNDTSVAIMAAIGGQGILLSRRRLVEDDIAAGRLALPFELDLPLEFSWHIVAPDDTLNRPEVSAFKAWLLTEARNDETKS